MSVDMTSEMIQIDHSPVRVECGPWQRRDFWRFSCTLTLWIGDDPVPVWLTIVLSTQHDLGPVEWVSSDTDTRLRLQLPPWVRYPHKRSWVTSVSGYCLSPEGSLHLDRESFFYVPIAFDPATMSTPAHLRAVKDGITYQLSWDEAPLVI